MKRFVVLFSAILLLLSGCALSGIKPYEKKRAPEPPKQTLIEKLIKPEPLKEAAPETKDNDRDIK